ncbi:MAG: Unknown protein [uncultured Thiotrichaceae bacterium]|uniref:ABC-type transport auxiliary lipoprotein component domain-containing protein n=1 Tax=uncultured Thiotrichaceae bacterium TaxID=298394 RepID=A0A6S6SVN3_9GAMM|nr:MAG: Unknown protein [uncultured Thiotrichaceae bacterium]
MKTQLFFILVFSLMLSACSIPFKSDLPKAQVYRLSPFIDVNNVQHSAQPIHLYIPSVKMTPGLDSNKIVLVVNPQKQSHIAESQWPDDLSVYLHSIIVDSFSASHAFASVSHRLLSKDQSYKLLINVSSFEVELPQSSVEKAIARVVMNVTLVDSKKQQLIWSKRMSASHIAKEMRTSELIKALNHAFGDTLNKLIQMVVGK